MNSFWCYLGYYTMAYPLVGRKKKVHGRNLGNRGKREASDGTSPMPGAYEDGKILGRYILWGNGLGQITPRY